MNFSIFYRTRTFAYCFFILAFLCIGGIFFLNRYFYLFESKEGNAANESYDVASVDIKKLNTQLFEANSYRDLIKIDSASPAIGDSVKGKRNPFLPN